MPKSKRRKKKTSNIASTVIKNQNGLKHSLTMEAGNFRATLPTVWGFRANKEIYDFMENKFLHGGIDELDDEGGYQSISTDCCDNCNSDALLKNLSLSSRDIRGLDEKEMFQLMITRYLTALATIEAYVFTDTGKKPTPSTPPFIIVGDENDHWDLGAVYRDNGAEFSTKWFAQVTGSEMVAITY